MSSVDYHIQELHRKIIEQPDNLRLLMEYFDLLQRVPVLSRTLPVIPANLKSVQKLLDRIRRLGEPVYVSSYGIIVIRWYKDSFFTTSGRLRCEYLLVNHRGHYIGGNLFEGFTTRSGYPFLNVFGWHDGRMRVKNRFSEYRVSINGRYILFKKDEHGPFYHLPSRLYGYYKYWFIKQDGSDLSCTRFEGVKDFDHHRSQVSSQWGAFSIDRDGNYLSEA